MNNKNPLTPKEHMQLCFKSEKAFQRKFSKMINECKKEDLDVGTVLEQLIYQSFDLVFKFTDDVEVAVDLVRMTLDKMLQKHLPGDSEDLKLVDSKNINQIH
ncbi:hypothetical protein M9C84_02600 [SAR86 cluster bacterium]|nr:hypothetical protein M9C84_02600 [SAR86 cluster bacterium]